MKRHTKTIWTPELDRAVLDARSSGHRAHQIAAQIGVSTASVQNRIAKLKRLGMAVNLEVVRRGLPDPVGRFHDLVDRSGGPNACWPWVGRISSNQYGKVGFKVGDLPADIGAHRVAYFLRHGSMPASGLVVRHRCDNPPCCNPDHLEAGTYSQNRQDCQQRGRHHGLAPRGERVWNALLTDEMVRDIRRSAARGEVRAEIASRLGVSKSCIQSVVNGRSWRHVE